MIVCWPPTRTDLRHAVATVALLTGALATIACERAVSSVPRTRGSVPDTARTSAQRTDGPDSALRFPFVPDPLITPGATLDVTAVDICVPGYSKRVRNVPAAVKRRAYAIYGVRSHQPGEYEVDHLIALQLGGSNSIANLWPQSFRTDPWNAYVKDELEIELHRRVCAGTMDLATAQKAIASNWVISYRKYVHPNPASSNARETRRARAHRTSKSPRQFDSPVP
jgi:hypothetical protein